MLYRRRKTNKIKTARRGARFLYFLFVCFFPILFFFLSYAPRILLEVFIAKERQTTQGRCQPFASPVRLFCYSFLRFVFPFCIRICCYFVVLTLNRKKKVQFLRRRPKISRFKQRKEMPTDKMSLITQAI